ncbi:hypothetical protein IWX90DRAFT_515640 [Phyllosticta citrichinensis]|uniref:Rhodopsin domain-containing protein n=1 Tax=Phyllosticta citrichinensis TaxID=1130410 RepID=A0ABR1XP67_9PEZI
MSFEDIENFLRQPALAPPDGVTPDFDNPPNENALAWFVTIFCMVVATTFFLLRAYGRLFVEKKFGIEEAMMICAYGAYWGTAYTAHALIATPGYFVHTWNLHNGDLVRPLYLILVYSCCYSVVLPLLKTAILLDWCRIFVPSSRSDNIFWWCCVAISIFQCVWGIMCIGLLNGQCSEHKAIWEFWLQKKCYSFSNIMLTSASVQVATDIVMALLPHKFIWSLQMSLTRKLGISIIFSVGLVACISACLRLVHTVIFSRTQDTMYYIGPLLFWACAEMTCGFLILSVPCLPKIIKHQREKKSTGPRSYGTRSGSHPKTRINSESYYKMQEDGVSMPSIDKLDSQVRLQDVEPVTSPVRVMRTTQITVTCDFMSEAQSEVDLRGRVSPWIRQLRD